MLEDVFWHYLIVEAYLILCEDDVWHAIVQSSYLYSSVIHTSTRLIYLEIYREFVFLITSTKNIAFLQ